MRISIVPLAASFVLAVTSITGVATTTPANAAPSATTSVSQGIAVVEAAVLTATSPICATVHMHREKTIHRTFTSIIHRGNLWVKFCRRPQAGPDIWWDKPYSWAAAYNYNNPYLATVYLCGIAGRFDGVTYRLYIKNNYTGYNASSKIFLPCQMDTINADAKGLIHLPRCYIPYVRDGGRDPEGERKYCTFKITYQEHIEGQVDRTGNVGSGYIW